MPYEGDQQLEKVSREVLGAVWVPGLHLLLCCPSSPAAQSLESLWARNREGLGQLELSISR